MKRRLLALLLAGAVLTGLCLPAFAQDITVTDSITVSGDYDWDRLADEKITLNVYNWGQYISGGDSDSEDVLGVNLNIKPKR